MNTHLAGTRTQNIQVSTRIYVNYTHFDTVSVKTYTSVFLNTPKIGPMLKTNGEFVEDEEEKERCFDLGNATKTEPSG